jgi:hypothetical protein
MKNVNKIATKNYTINLLKAELKEVKGQVVLWNKCVKSGSYVFYISSKSQAEYWAEKWSNISQQLQNTIELLETIKRLENQKIT